MVNKKLKLKDVTNIEIPELDKESKSTVMEFLTREQQEEDIEPQVYSTTGAFEEEIIENDNTDYHDNDSVVKCESKVVQQKEIKQSMFNYMNEEKALSRWVVLRIGMIGLLTGTILGFVVAVVGLVKI